MKIDSYENSIKEENLESEQRKSIMPRSKTTATRLKLQSKNSFNNINIQNYIQIMKTEISNRGISEIDDLMQFLKSFKSFYSYLSLNGDDDSTDQLLSEIAWIIFHKKYKKNTLMKKPGEKNEYFYLVMTGKIQKVTMVFKKEKITLEEYLIFLLKMKLINEYELLKKCRQINKSILDINYNNIEYFCDKNPRYNYQDLLEKATKEIINLGFDPKRIHSDENIDIPSIQNYLAVGEIKRDIKSQDNKGAKIYLYIPKYELSYCLLKGDYFGFLTKDIITEYSSYICVEDCDIGYINKNKIYEDTIFEHIDLALSKYFNKNKNKYYIFKDINLKTFNENYLAFINYKKFKKGDKIILQGSLYEGIYLIKSGEIKISTYSKLNDLTKLMLGLIWSFKGFKEHVPPSEFKNIIKDKNNDNNNNSINENNIPYEEENKEIDFGSLKEGDILGLNELYDYNNSIFNFTAECVSKEACLFYINKNNFNLILSKENSLYDSVIQKVELRIKFMIGTIKNYKRFFSRVNITKSKRENLKIGTNNSLDTKQLKSKNLKQNFNTSSWNKSKEKSSIDLMKKNISSDKKYSRNNNAMLMNNINCYMPSIREKLFQSPSTLKTQDKIYFHQIFEKNNRIKNFNNNLLNTNAYNFLTIKEPHYENNNEEENKLLKNLTYKNLNRSTNGKNYKIYNFTTPNNLKGKNRSNLIYENTNENSKDKLPFLYKERTIRINRPKNNINYTHIIFHG